MDVGVLPVVAVIAGASQRVVRADEPLALNATGSADPNRGPSGREGSGVQFQWSHCLEGNFGNPETTLGGCTPTPLQSGDFGLSQGV